ncbi:hypothetical protein CY35_13G043400 [Sphagnum magellanicum]|nr:hypothetical protein CY35_13G043400 [Sphagnum magellanicum]
MEQRQGHGFDKGNTRFVDAHSSSCILPREEEEEENDDDHLQKNRSSADRVCSRLSEERMIKVSSCCCVAEDSSPGTTSVILQEGHLGGKAVVAGKENLRIVAAAAAAAAAKVFAGRRRGDLKTRSSGSGLLEVLNWQLSEGGHEVVMSDDVSLREKKMKEEEEEKEIKELRQQGRSNFENMNSMEVVFRERVNEVELHVDALRKRLERAEEMIADLKHCHAEEENSTRRLQPRGHGLSDLQKDDEEQKDLQELVNGLQELCMNKSLVDRLRRAGGGGGGAAATTTSCSGASKKKRLDQELRAQLYREQAQATALQEKNELLASRLRLAMRHRRSMKEVMRESEARLAQVVEESKTLRLELARTRRSLRARENDVHILERQVEVITASNHLLQASLSLRSQTALACKQRFADLQQHRNEIAMENHEEAQQQYVQEDIELLAGLPEENLSKKTVSLIHCMEQALMDLTSIVSSQNSCVVRLSTQNEELARASQLQLQQIQDLLQSATAIKRQETAVEQCKQQLGLEYWRPVDLQHHQLVTIDGTGTSSSTCEMLQEYAITLEEDLRQSQAHCTLLVQDLEDLRLERYELLCSLADSYSRLSELERELNEKVELMKELETDLDKSTHDVKETRKEISVVTRERDELRKEGETLSRETMHMSLEVELLQRRLHQLDEELLLKDGQISILRSHWEDDEDDQE